jgi:pyridoxamine 5'-phosphate oxidase
MDLSVIRKEYQLKSLDVGSVHENPISQLEKWLDEAAATQCLEHSAMTLATANADGQPSTRVVLLKYIKNEGLIFFTNYKSSKANDLLMNPKVAANFFWPELERQVRIEGLVTKTESEVSDLYFHSRSFESQISVIISPQSSNIPDRSAFEKDWNKMFFDWSGIELIRPDHWNGFLLTPDRVEFWQGRPHRLHDRIVYKKQSDGWKIKRIAPTLKEILTNKFQNPNQYL